MRPRVLLESYSLRMDLANFSHHIALSTPCKDQTLMQLHFYQRNSGGFGELSFSRKIYDQGFKRRWVRNDVGSFKKWT